MNSDDGYAPYSFMENDPRYDHYMIVERLRAAPPPDPGICECGQKLAERPSWWHRLRCRW